MKKTMIGALAAILLWTGLVSPGFGRPHSSPTANRMDQPWLGIRFDLTSRPWSLAAKVIGFNLGVWTISRFVRKDPWSYISRGTIRRNFETGLVWDNDTFLMNTLCHPGHGAAYFAIARTSGMSFWESAPFALGGSAMWEAFMENEPSSANDLIFTTFGGIYFGEILHRLSGRIRNDRARGLERAGRELFAFVLNPVEGLHRLLRGDTFRYRASAESGRGPFETSCAVGRSGGAAALSLIFRAGDPFAGEDAPQAFDVFVHRSRFQFGKTFATTQSGYGYLAGTRVGTKGDPRHLLGLFLHYDFHKTAAVRMAGPSLGAGLLSHFRIGATAELRTAVHLGAMLIGACDNPYVRMAGWMERDYDFGSGAFAKAEASLSAGRWGNLRLNAAFHYLDVFKGSAGTDRAGFWEAGYEIPVFKSWSIGAEIVDIRRDSDYRDVRDIRTGSREIRLIGSVRF